jgi:hypothetical protein
MISAVAQLDRVWSSATAALLSHLVFGFDTKAFEACEPDICPSLKRLPTFGGSRCELVSEMPNFPEFRRSRPRRPPRRQRKREFAYRELNRAIRESFALIRESLSSAICAFALLTIVAPDLEPCREGRTETPPEREKRRSKSPKPISSSPLSIPRRAAKSLAERVDANDRAFRASRWRRGPVARTRVHRAHRRGGPSVRIRLPPAVRWYGAGGEGDSTIVPGK